MVARISIGRDGNPLLQQQYVVTQHSEDNQNLLENQQSRSRKTEGVKFAGGKGNEKPRPAKSLFDHRLATQEQIESLLAQYPLPPAQGSSTLQRLRYDIGSTYRRLHAVVVLLNAALIFWIIARVRHDPASFTYADASTAVAANLCVATLMRHEHCINALFRLATSPWMRRAPLALRRRAAKIYSFGGVHSGCGVAAVMWYIVFAVLLGTTARRQPFHHPLTAHALYATTAIMLVLFMVIITMAHPSFRARWHNAWELSHRYAGWTAIGVIWTQTILGAVAAAEDRTTLGSMLIQSPAFWLLITISALFIYPWLLLRRRKLEAEPLSDHAVRLWFPSGGKLETCVGTRLSSNPLRENHGFATIPNEHGQAGFSVLVSNAGDWTSQLIKNPPTHFWTRGAFTMGVLRVALLFQPVVLVATGSGIGPCLSFLQVHPAWPVRILWSTRRPERTYSAGILASVYNADPRAVVVDAKRFRTTCRPDLPALAFALYREVGAEAVVIISNPRATREVVGRLERRGVPAFGAIFDS